MATLPPPYSQRDAARAQRYYQRSLRRPSMLSPVVLMCSGCSRCWSKPTLEFRPSCGIGTCAGGPCS